MNYAEKLKDPRWQKKRLGILQRDEWCCALCGDDKSTLHVHHRRYVFGREPWDYDDSLLVTLCAECHEHEKERWSEISSDLINILKEKFFADDVHDIAAGFANIEMAYHPCVVASAIKWILESRDIQAELIVRYFDSLKKK